MSLKDYFEVQKNNLNKALQFEPFAVPLSGVDELYETALQAIPPEGPPVFGGFVLFCHKSFLAAASLVGQAQPDDAAPITRRAIEAVRLAAAIKENPANLQEWIAFEERMKRWQARQEGKKPGSLFVRIDVKHPVILELMETWGILSDASVHFTPEYFASLGWIKGDTLRYFTDDQRILEREIALLAATHGKILHVLDWCLDGAFGRNPQWMRLMSELYGKR